MTDPVTVRGDFLTLWDFLWMRILGFDYLHGKLRWSAGAVRTCLSCQREWKSIALGGGNVLEYSQTHAHYQHGLVIGLVGLHAEAVKGFLVHVFGFEQNGNG